MTPLFCETQKTSILQENKETYFQSTLPSIAGKLFELSNDVTVSYHVDSPNSSFAIENQVSWKSDVRFFCKTDVFWVSV